jgi:dienelactone hydrolase
MRFALLVLRLLGLGLRRLLAPAAGLVDKLVHPGEAPDSFRDHARQRSIPYRLYPPQGADGPAPVVIFSHGLGGSTEAAPYLGRALSAAGYWGIFLQHPGSDRAVFEGAADRDAVMRRLRGAMMNPVSMRDRFLDLPFVLDRLAELNAEPGGPFENRFDLARVGAAGHSYGARTVLAAAGQRIGGFGAAFHERRLRAGLLLSPSGGRRPGAGQAIVPAADFAGVSIPLLHVTGTRDGLGPGTGPGQGPLVISAAEGDPATRTLPFRMIPAKEQYLLVFDGATHGVFSGTERGETPPDSRYSRAVALAAVLFFDAYLRDSAAARRALREEFPATLEPGDRFEFR